MKNQWYNREEIKKIVNEAQDAVEKSINLSIDYSEVEMEDMDKVKKQALQDLVKKLNKQIESL